MTSIKVSLYAGFALALPVILWQVWSFFAPARRATGRSVSIGWFVAFATVLFAGGVVFGHQVALPAAVHFLTNYDSDIYDIQVRAQRATTRSRCSCCSRSGSSSSCRSFILGLVRLGILSAAKLRRNRRIGYVAVAALAVALPGVDPVTTAFEMVPLMVLFEASIWLSVIFERRWRARSTAPAPTCLLLRTEPGAWPSPAPAFRTRASLSCAGSPRR